LILKTEQLIIASPIPLPGVPFSARSIPLPGVPFSANLFALEFFYPSLYI
jgi:hypothetical protein